MRDRWPTKTSPSRRIYRAFFLLARCLGSALLACISSVGVAQDEEYGTFTFVHDNDLFSGSDRHYTGGFRLIVMPGRSAPTPAWLQSAARLLPAFSSSTTLRHGYAIGQSAFTPDNISQATPPIDDRPYAGWLYGTAGVGAVTGNHLDLFSLTVGVIGPSSQADQMQQWLHKLTGSRQPQGWSTQLHDEPGLLLNYQRRWSGYSFARISNHVSISPHVGLAFGNVNSFAGAGVAMRVGRGLPNDFGPPRIQSVGPMWTAFEPSQRIGVYAFISFEERAVANNIFLDGNTFRDSSRVDRNAFVEDLQAGIVIDHRSLRISYTHVLQSHEFKTQRTNDQYGALMISVRY